MDTVISALAEYKIYFIGGAVIAGIIWGVVKLVSPSQRQKQQSGHTSVNVQAGRDAKVDHTKVD